MVEGRKVFFNITLKDIRTRTGKADEPFQSSMSSKSNPIGIGIMNKSALENGGDDITKSVMDYSIPIRCGRYQATFGVYDVEGSIGSRMIILALRYPLC
jgi:hypothetical protein